MANGLNPSCPEDERLFIFLVEKEHGRELLTLWMFSVHNSGQDLTVGKAVGQSWLMVGE